MQQREAYSDCREAANVSRPDRTFGVRPAVASDRTQPQSKIVDRSRTIEAPRGGRAILRALRRGAVAQLGERLNGIQEVDGSIPFSSTKPFSPGRLPLPSDQDPPGSPLANEPIEQKILEIAPAVQNAEN